MSSPFKYEIDERNLRLRLKENELQFSEEAWQKFESFSSAQKSVVNDTIIRRFNLSMNRNVVLPVVFGAVIVLFSLLLFNFINIKNPNTESAENTSPVEEIIPAEEVKKPEPAPAKAIVPAEVKDTVTAETLPAKTEAGPENSGRASEERAREKQISSRMEREEAKRSDTTPSESVESPKQDSNTIVPAGVQEEYTPVIKKKRRKREMVVTEPTQEEAEQAPPPVETAP